MRAIDADAFDERVRAAGGMSEEELTEDFKDGVQAVLYMLSNQPTIQPKKGRWIKLDMHIGMADHKCTACEQECYVPTCMGEPMYAFCPNCGADMREVTT